MRGLVKPNVNLFSFWVIWCKVGGFVFLLLWGYIFIKEVFRGI